MNIYFIFCVLIQSYFIYFVLQIIPALAPLLFWQLILYITCPSSRISHFSKQSWFLSLENDDIRNQDLSTEYAHYCCTVIDPRSSRLK